MGHGLSARSTPNEARLPLRGLCPPTSHRRAKAAAKREEMPLAHFPRPDDAASAGSGRRRTGTTTGSMVRGPAQSPGGGRAVGRTPCRRAESALARLLPVGTRIARRRRGRSQLHRAHEFRGSLRRARERWLGPAEPPLHSLRLNSTRQLLSNSKHPWRPLWGARALVTATTSRAPRD